MAVGSTSPAPATAVDDDFPDAPAYAELFAVSLQDARSELRQSHDASVLQEVLMASIPEQFGGMWIQHDPDFRIVVALRGGQGREVVEGASPKAIADVLTFTSVAYSEIELQRVAYRTRAATDANLSVNVDLKNGRVEAITEDVGKLLTPSFSEFLTENPEVEVKVVDTLGGPSVNIYGGLVIGCMSGFSVKGNGTTVTGVMTAGHCGSASYQGVNLPYVAGDAKFSYDAQWHSTPGLTDVPKFKYTSSGSTRNVTHAYTDSELVIGGTLCKYGSVTGYTCGELVSKSFCPNWIDRCYATFLQVKNCSVDMSSPGDSGGPVFFGGNAAGIVSGWTHDIFCATDYLIASRITYSQVGAQASVLISP